MANQNPYAQYRDQSVSTSTPGELIVMLFNGAIKNINIANSAVDSNDVQTAHNMIVKTQNIFIALRASLDQSLDVSRSISELYDYIIDRLVMANVKKDKTLLAEILELSLELRDTWQEAERKTRISARSMQRA